MRQRKTLIQYMVGRNEIDSWVYNVYLYPAIQMAVASKAEVCSRSVAGIVGSNPARDMDVCLF